MADMGLAIGRWRAVIKRIFRAVCSGLNTLFKNIFVFPELFNILFPLYKIEICVYFLVHRHFPP